MTLALIAIAFMALTITLKWFTTSSIVSKRSKLSEAMDVTGQAKFRLKIAVKEVTAANGEIDKLKRKIKISQRKAEKLQKEYKEFNTQAKQDAEMNAEKLRLANELKQRKGEA
ncbi:MAG: peptidoglycan hydrolase CwlO-like protein [Candidatus Latescibacterota bacterium]|jgi:peptidoglycan hydrolase CwlO-like protein